MFLIVLTAIVRIVTYDLCVIRGWPFMTHKHYRLFKIAQIAALDTIDYSNSKLNTPHYVVDRHVYAHAQQYLGCYNIPQK